MNLALKALKEAKRTGLLKHVGLDEVIAELEKGNFSRVVSTTYIRGNPHATESRIDLQK